MKMKKRFCKTFAMARVIGAFAASSGCGGQNGDSTSDEGMYISPAQARGYSFSDPVFDENGNVDMEASRRVAVKFYIQVD